MAFDLAPDQRQQKIAGHAKTSASDCFGGRDERCHSALHVVDPHSVDPAILNHRASPVSRRIGQVLLVSVEGNIDVPIEKQRRATARALQASDAVVASWLEFLKRRVQARPAQ